MDVVCLRKLGVINAQLEVAGCSFRRPGRDDEAWNLASLARNHAAFYQEATFDRHLLQSFISCMR